jgi:hypothetical protein
MKFSKPFRGVPDGEIYPVDYEPGQECPPELEASAIALEAVDAGGATGNDKLTVAQLRDELTARGIAFDPAAKKADLLVLLEAQ